MMYVLRGGDINLKTTKKNESCIKEDETNFTYVSPFFFIIYFYFWIFSMLHK